MKTCPESPALDLSGIAPAPVEAAVESDNLPVAQESRPPFAPPPGGYDLADFKWVPVLRKPRADGWSPQRQVDFIAALADTGCVDHAAQEVDMSITSCYRLRRSPGAEAFAAAWDAAIAQASRRLVDIAFDRAIHGTDEPVFDKEGRRIGRRMRQNDRLLMFLLRAYMPNRFRHAHESVRRPSEPVAPAPLPVAEALRTLEPPPEDPHLLLPAGYLGTALQCAHILDGKLPLEHQGARESPDPQYSSLGDDFERELEAAKRAAAGPACDQQEEDDETSFLA
jgi:hypothetical protein